eukprot:COSAG02_NODE_7325_length_3062_cov_1.894364_2_plen_234_part_00
MRISGSSFTGNQASSQTLQRPMGSFTSLTACLIHPPLDLSSRCLALLAATWDGMQTVVVNANASQVRATLTCVVRVTTASLARTRSHTNVPRVPALISERASAPLMNLWVARPKARDAVTIFGTSGVHRHVCESRQTSHQTATTAISSARMDKRSSCSEIKAQVVEDRSRSKVARSRMLHTVNRYVTCMIVCTATYCSSFLESCWVLAAKSLCDSHDFDSHAAMFGRSRSILV